MGTPRALTSDNFAERYITGGFLGAGTLVAVYNRVELSTKETTALATRVQTMNLSIPSPGSTNLYMVSYAIESDVAAQAGRLSMRPPNPQPGDAVNLVASVVNQGPVAHANIPVRFYKGDPAVDGVEVATVLVDGSLPPGRGATAAFAWVAPDVVDPVSLDTVIDADHTLDDANRVNNTMSETVVMPDLVATTSRWEQTGPTTMIVYVRVSNQGALEGGARTVELRLNCSAGDLPLSDTVGPLAPLALEDIGVFVDISTCGDSALTIFATLDSSNAITEFDEDNNTLMVTLQPDDFDKDGVPNHIDLDDEGDGLSDADEETWGTTP